MRNNLNWRHLIFADSMKSEMRDIEDIKIASLEEAKKLMPGFLRTDKEVENARCLIRELVEMEFDSKSQFNEALHRLKNGHHLHCKNSELAVVYRQMLRDGEVERNEQVEFFIRTKIGKSASGILSITVFTSPYPTFLDEKTGKTKTQRFTCKWNCYFCPNHPDHPRSYLPDEPGCLRAERCGFDAILQMKERIATLKAIGHPVDKLEVLVLGGTWESYPHAYREIYIRDLFYAANTFFTPEPCREARSLSEEQLINESANCKIIGLTLETRPDTISPESIRELRRLGCTRLQLGIQHIDNDILKLINRQHTIEHAAKALRLLKDNCYKVDIHIMPDLPGASPEIDKAMFDNLLGLSKPIQTISNRHFQFDLVNDDIQADQWKIYPCEVTPWTVIEKWFKEGKYQPYGGGEGPELIDVIIHAKRMVFPWIRLNRVIRDIPNQHILGGNADTNLRQYIQKLMKSKGFVCNCIRCREVGLNNYNRQDVEKAVLFIREYNAQGAREFFLSFETPNQQYIYGFLRLRLSHTAGIGVFPALENAALIRELHVYGQLIPTYTRHSKSKSSQHAGFGKRLLVEAERIAVSNGFSKLAVIAGIGTRNYYRKFGYELSETFMVKWISFSSRLSIILHEDNSKWLIYSLVVLFAFLALYIFL